MILVLDSKEGISTRGDKYYRIFRYKRR